MAMHKLISRAAVVISVRYSSTRLIYIDIGNASLGAVISVLASLERTSLLKDLPRPRSALATDTKLT